MVGVGLIKSKSSVLMDLFGTDKDSRAHVKQFNDIGDRNRFGEKWYRHLC